MTNAPQPNAFEQLEQVVAERLRAGGLPVESDTLAGLSHGQTLGASLPLLLHRLAAANPERDR